ncbi:MAG: cell division protein FtsA [Chlorobiaceae bacterium]|nr:cell division protein FtsA [Chlorobiaceae bacterium]MBA4309677.1 cell division protein FtsA [Chlorobiaceae bacterium]
MKKNIIAGLDLGTTKVCAVISEIQDDKIKILGFGVAVSEGMHRGLVNNISKTSEAIKTAVSIAENRAGVAIKQVNVGVAGEHITSLRHRNYVTITNEDHEITKEDLQRLENDVRTIRIPGDKQILHIIPEEFFVDDQGQIDNPIGMTGSRLEATNHIVLASAAAMQNIKKAVERAGLQVNQYILQPIASSASVLEESEKDLGTLLIDIGGGTTDIAIIHHKAIKHSKVFGVAGNQVTNDIRETLGVIDTEAEKLKKEYGFALVSSIIEDKEIIIRTGGARANVKIPTSVLTQIISYRMRELFTLIDNAVKSEGLKSKIRSGVVLTGGGSLLRGVTDLAEEVFGLPARLGVPLEQSTGVLSEIEKPEFATVVGLLKGVPGVKATSTTIKFQSTNKKKRKNPFKAVWNGINQFFKDL